MRIVPMQRISRDQLAKDLRRLGVREGDCVMLHSSLSRLGYVDGGAETVIDSFLDALGPSGTLITPAFTEGAWAEHLAMPDCRAVCPQTFCPSQSVSHEGAIPNVSLQRPGRLRSCHPTHSWVANGARAKEVLRNNVHSPTPCGRGNPFEALCDLDGCIVTLGVGVNTITLWHYFEDLLDVPYCGHFHEKERHLSYCTAGRRIQYEFPGIMQEVVHASGIMTRGRVGQSESGLIRARTFRSFLATILTSDPYCLIVRPPDRHSDDFAVDALGKAAGMLRAWRSSPRKNPDPIEWYPGEDNAVVREDCPAFAGYHDAAGQRHALCRANDRHLDLFRHGELFGRHGKTTCGRCPWHHQYPRVSPASADG
ncbi:AAC(3) family N-acetyltransferase [Chloroflexi bacterium TSY]|nr:AAC(3) family N-acetyltransferase [Chloroflexi bacterium TSY]